MRVPGNAAVRRASSRASAEGLCRRYAMVATLRRELLSDVGFHQRDVLRHRVPVLPRREVLCDVSGDLRMLLHEHAVRLDHSLARNCAARVAVHGKRQQCRRDLRRRARAVAQVLFVDPCHARRAAKFEVGGQHRGQVRRIARFPCRFQALIEGGGVARSCRQTPAAGGKAAVARRAAGPSATRECGARRAAASPSASRHTARRRARRTRARPPAARNSRDTAARARRGPASPLRSCPAGAFPRRTCAASPTARRRSRRGRPRPETDPSARAAAACPSAPWRPPRDRSGDIRLRSCCSKAARHG